MKTKRIIMMLAVGLLVAAALVTMGCQKATEAASYAGSSTYYFPVHQSGIVAEASVTTDKNGAVTDAYLNEWMGPGSWAAGAGTLVGGEIVRVKMAGMNATTVVVDSVDASLESGYVFFYYNFNSKGWVEYSLPTTTAAYTAPSAATAATVPTFDLRMGNQLYSKAYADACNAAVASAANTDLTTVTIAQPGGATFPIICTVGANNAATLVAQAGNTSGALKKSDPASFYFPMTASNLGYRENYKAMLAFFKTNPTADYAAATLTAGVDLLTGKTWTTDYTNQPVANPSVNYTAAATATDVAGKDHVWEVADVVSGATYSDFRAYAMGLQTAYLMAIGDTKDGNVRSIK